MCFGINLRGDLAKLSDGEIASTLETLISRRETMSEDQWPLRLSPLSRGPLRAPIFYKFFALPYVVYFGKPHVYDRYLVDCELMDVRDEIERRVRRANRQR